MSDKNKQTPIANKRPLASTGPEAAQPHTEPPGLKPGEAPKPFVQQRTEEEAPEIYGQARDRQGDAVDTVEGEENKSPLHPIDKNKSPEDWQLNKPHDQPDVVEDKKEHDAVEE